MPDGAQSIIDGCSSNPSVTDRTVPPVAGTTAMRVFA